MTIYMVHDLTFRILHRIIISITTEKKIDNQELCLYILIQFSRQNLTKQHFSTADTG